jgi:glycosyltransferase involved in cell wall biosynthesis/SAM-dependent methyltransferase
MELSLPPVRSFRQVAHRQNGWSDHYGAFHAATSYAGAYLPEPYTIAGVWQHGVFAPWECSNPRLLACSVPQAEGKPVWVARQDEAESLARIGFRRARAVGLPFVYVPPVGLARLPRSLLIMPGHSLVGWKAPDRTVYELYADQMREVAKDFARVVVCISPSCQKNGFWVREFTERGFEIVEGAATSDANALLRMRMLFEQFETMTTNAWGSHVAYALSCGAKVSIHGARPSLELSNFMLDTAWKSDPVSLKNFLSSQMREEERKLLRDFHVEPREAVADVERGDWFLGRNHRLSPEQMKEALAEMIPVPSTPITSSKASVARPRRVLFLAHGPAQVNGPNIWLTRLLPALKARGFAPRVLMFMTRTGACPIAEQLRAAGIGCETAPWSHTEDMVRLIVQHVREHPCEVFVPNLNVQGYFAASLLKAAGIPTVGVLHSDDDFHRDLIDEFIRGQGGRYLSAAVTVSQFQEEALRALDLGPTRVLRAPYGAPVPDSAAQHRSRPFRFVYVGRLVEEQKRVSDTVRGMIALLRRQPDAEFHLCGDGKARPAVEALIAEAALGDRIRLHGNLAPEEVRRVLLDSQALVLLSDYEGIPIALMEAMACGLVPLCSRIRSGVGELVRDGENGLLVEDREQGLIAAAERLMGDPALWARCSAAARDTILQGFSTEANAQVWADLLGVLITAEGYPSRAVEMPAALVLPPRRANPKGIAREDRRRPAAQTTPPVPVNSSPSLAPASTAPHPFLNPPLEPNNADLYVVRSTLLRAVQAALPHFHGRFLDIGCGVMPYRGLITAAPSRVSHYIGLDLEGSEIYHAKVDLRWDGKTIPLPDASVDCAMATEVLEHCPEPLVVLREARRVLKPGGTFFFTVPFIWPLHDAPYDFFRYTPFALEKLLAEAGFENVQLGALGGWNASLAQVIGLWLKRSPMSPEARNQMARQLWPLYQQLVKTDELPADPRAGNTLATGWSGLAQSPAAATPVAAAAPAAARPATEPAPAALPTCDLPLVLVRSHEFNYSETFLEDHVAHLSSRLTLLYGWPFPRFLRGGRSVLRPDTESALAKALAEGGKITPELWRSYGRDLAVWLRASGARVALLESGLMGSFLHEACEAAGLPFVVHFHGVDAFSRELLERWSTRYRKFFNTAHCVVGVSRAMCAQLRVLGAPEERVVLAPYGVDVDPPARAQPGEAPPAFLAVGRFVEKKAPLHTLRAFARVHLELPEARLVMIGDGPLLESCRRWAADNGLSAAVDFAGVRTRAEVSAAMARARVFVQHSVIAPNGDSEGLPLAVLEAGAHGLPVVSTRHAGIPDAVVHGAHGYLVAEHDIDGMADAMLRLARDPALAAELGAAFHGRVTAEYSRRVSIERLQALLLAAAEGGRTAGAAQVVEARLAAEQGALRAEIAAARAAGEIEREAAALQTLLGVDRGDSSAYLRLGELLRGAGDEEGAYLCYREAGRLGGEAEGLATALASLESGPAGVSALASTYREQIGEVEAGSSATPHRILVVTNLFPPQELGGYGRTMWEFCDLLVRRGHEVKVLTADCPEWARPFDPGQERLESRVERTLELFGTWKKGAAVPLADRGEIGRIAAANTTTILEALRDFRATRVLAGNLDFVGYDFMRHCLGKKIPVLHRLGNGESGYPPDTAWESPLFCLAGNTEWLNRRLQEKGYRAGRWAVVYPGSPLEHYYRAFPPRFDRLRIAYASIFAPFKGPQVLFEALAQLARAGIDFTLECAGEQPDPAFKLECERAAERGGFAERVRWHGFINRAGLAAMFSRCNTLVFPSVFEEPFGKTQIEAMAAGLAVVSSGTGGTPEIVRPEVNGLLFKSRDAADLARQLRLLPQDPVRWARLASQGQTDAYRFTTAESVRRIEAFFDTALREPGRASAPSPAPGASLVATAS